MKETKKYYIFDVLKKSSIFLLMLFFFIMMITSLGFFAKISVTSLHLPVIYIFTILVFLLLYRKDKINKKIVSLILATFIFVIGIWAIGHFYDITQDGNTYHKLAIGQLKNGWNPVYESSRDFNKEQGNAFDILDENYNPMWVDHYPKGTEIFASTIYAVTGNIETGKVFTVLLMYIVFGLITSYLVNEKNKNVIFSLLIGFLLVVNPISLVQFNNYYVDATIMFSIAIILLELVAIADKNKKTDLSSQIERYLVLAAGIAICINAKFTGIAFAAMFCFAFYVYWLILAYKEGKEIFIKKLKEYSIFYVIAVVISVGVIGYTSYFHNFISFGHPLYPLYNEPTVQNIPEKEQPKSFADKNHLETFLISLFSKGENVLPSYPVDQNQPELKVPFTTSKEEIKNYTIPDIRIGGFGPLFSGVIILAGIATIYLLVKYAIQKRWNIFIPYVIILGVMAILILVIDGNYWARYISYFYIVPIMALIGLFEDLKNKKQAIAGVIIAIAMMFNIGLIAYSNFEYVIENNRYISRNLNEFKNYASTQETVKIKLNEYGFQSVCYNIDDMGITNYVIDQNIENFKDGLYFWYEI